MAKTSVLIPARNEVYLVKTIDDVLSKARGEVDVHPVLEGYWPVGWAELVAKWSPKIKTIHHGAPRGMRASINEAAAAAIRGGADFLCKMDGHILVGEGWDEILKPDCEENMILIPRRYRLDAENWKIIEDGRPPIDYHYLSYPFANPDEPGNLQGKEWRERAVARKDIPVDEEMLSQGSMWFMRRKHWQRLGDMDERRYGTFTKEMLELGLRTWLGGGCMKVSKKTWYAHLWKRNRGYRLSQGDVDAGSQWALRFWMMDRWKNRRRNLRWLIEHFAPVPTWPADLDEAFRYAHDVLKKK